MKTKGLKVFCLILATACLLLSSACGSANATPNENEQSKEVVDVNTFDNVSILNYGAKADGSADISSAVTNAASLVGEKQAIYFPNGVYSVDSDLTINCAVKLSGNVTIKVAAGKTLTINGLFGAGIQPIFTGEGNVNITSPDVWGYVEWFADTAGENNTVRFQKAIDSLRSLYIQAGNYDVGELNITTPTNIKGIGARRVTLNAQSGINSLFNIQSGGVSIEGFLCIMSKSPSAVCFYMNNTANNVDGVEIIQCEAREAITSLTDANTDYAVSNILLSGVDFTNVRGTAIHTRDFTNNIKFIEVAVHRREYGGNSLIYNMGVPGAIFENADGMLFEHFDVNGEANIVNGVQREWVNANIGGHGCVFRNCKNVRMIRTLMEYLAGTGFVIENCSKFSWENVEVYTFHGYGFDINGLTDSEFRVAKALVAGGDPERSEENFRLRNLSNVTFTGMITNNSRVNAVSVQNCDGLTVNALSVFERYKQTSIGLYDMGGNKNVVINGMVDDGPANTSAVLTGSGVVINNAVIGSGIKEQISAAGTY